VVRDFILTQTVRTSKRWIQRNGCRPTVRSGRSCYSFPFKSTFSEAASNLQAVVYSSRPNELNYVVRDFILTQTVRTSKRWIQRNGCRPTVRSGRSCYPFPFKSTFSEAASNLQAVVYSSRPNELNYVVRDFILTQTVRTSKRWIQRNGCRPTVRSGRSCYLFPF
jgi:hypothetical protein